MTPWVPVAMFGWIPLVLGLFARLKAHHAVIAGFLLAWMFLPQYDYELPGLPNYSKISAASYGILAGTFIFNRSAFAQFRPCVYDLPIALWCVAPFLSSISNGLGAWDGLSASLGKVTSWGIPYFIGRLYFDRTEALRDLCLGIFLGALIYVPFCLYEMVMSPRLHKQVYGWHPAQFGQSRRGSSWRPVVFMKHGLMAAMWMASGALAGVRLLASKNLGKRLPVIPLPSLPAVATVVFLVFIFSSFGALALLVMGLGLIAVVTRLRRSWPMLLVVAIPILYMTTRGTGAWDGQNLIDASAALSSEERADSLAFRIKNENVLVQKALQQPLFGWGGWKRSFIFNENNVAVSVPDGLWVLAFGQNGLFGLTCLTMTLLLPQLLFLRRYPASRWAEPAVAALVPLSMMLGMFMIDNLFNDMFNPVMLLSAGGLTGLFLRRVEEDGGAVATTDQPAPAAGPRLL